MATQTQTADRTGTEPDRRGEDPAAARAVRRRAGGGQDGAGERAPRADVAGGRDAAAADRERRPGRQPPGQGLGADHDRPARARRSRAAARVPAAAGRQPRRRGQGRQRPRHALRVPGQRHEAALRHRLRRRVGPLYRRLRDEDPRLPGHHRLAPGRAGRGSAARRRRTTSPSTRSRPKAGTSPTRI